MSEILCERCASPALVIYQQKPLCGPCAIDALDERHHYLVVQVDDGITREASDAEAGSSTPS